METADECLILGTVREALLLVKTKVAFREDRSGARIVEALRAVDAATRELGNDPEAWQKIAKNYTDKLDGKGGADATGDEDHH